MFITHVDKHGVRSVAVVIEENETQYQVWFGGTMNRKPCVVWVDKADCRQIHKVFVYS